MAIYIYETTDPKKPVRRFELQQSMKDAAFTLHPETGEPIRRVITGGFGYASTGSPPKHADMKRERGAKAARAARAAGAIREIAAMQARPPTDSRRAQFPHDLFAIFVLPVIVAVMTIATGSLFPILNAMRHPSGWLITFYIASGASFVGVLLLFFAKLPQYRAGEFWRVGCRHLPPLQQRLYRAAFALLVPACIALLLLLVLADRVR